MGLRLVRIMARMLNPRPVGCPLAGGVLFLSWWTTSVVCEARMLGGSGGMLPRKFLNFILSEVASGGLCDPNLQPYCIQHVAT